MVKCPVCGEQFDKTIEPSIHSGRRYYHIDCYKKKEKEDQAIEEIHNRCERMFGMQYSKTKIDSQIRSIKEKNNISAELINMSLYYWYDVKHNDWNLANYGINIVGHIYPEAWDYFYKKAKNKEKNKDINYKELDEPIVEKYVISPTPLTKPKKIKLFDLR